jgi:hypothetical protein
MKKIYLMIATAFTLNAAAQATKDTIPETGLTDTSFGSTTSVRLPNGTANDRFTRGAFIITSSDLADINITTIVAGESITKIGFATADTVGTNPPARVSVADSNVTGTIIIYAKNTNDTIFNASLGGTSWSTLFATMTPIYTGPFNIVKDFVGEMMYTCNGSFVYTGAGLYLAFDYTRDATSKIVGNTFPSTTTPVTFGPAAASWDANAQLSASCFVNRSATTAPATLPTAGSAFRPCARIEHDFVSKVKTVKDNNTFNVYPNPNNGVFNVSVKGSPIQALEVMDATGKSILTKDASSINETIDISKFPAGIYFLKVNQAGKNKTMKFTKN